MPYTKSTISTGLETALAHLSASSRRLDDIHLLADAVRTNRLTADHLNFLEELADSAANEHQAAAEVLRELRKAKR